MLLPYARILIVDDSATTRRIIRSMLQGAGYRNFDEAADGGEALVLLRSRNYALVICDWMMVPMSGLDLLVAMRASPALRFTPFVMATAKAKRRFASVARDHGATRYLEKPFQPSELLSCIHSIWSERRAA